MKTIEKHKFSTKIASNNERKQSISWNLRIRHLCDYNKKKFRDDDDEHKRRQKFVIYVVNVMRIRKNEYCCDIVNRVTRKFAKALWKNRNSMCEIKQSTIARRNEHCVNDARVDDKWWFSNIHQSITSDATIESHCDWRMSYRIKQSTEFSQKNATVEQFDWREKRDVVVNDHIVF